MCNKKRFILLVLAIFLFSAGCGKKKDSDSVADSWTDTKTAVESELKVADANILGEILIKAQIPEIEGEELTTDEQLANLILEKTLIEELDENENFLFVKITYPDVGALLSEKDMGATPYGEDDYSAQLAHAPKRVRRMEILV